MRDPIRRGRAPGILLSAAIVTSVLWGPMSPARADTVVVNDGRDAGAGPDIQVVEAGHARDGRLRYRITAFGPFARSESPCLEIEAGLRRKGYVICGAGTVARRSDGATTGRAKVSRPNASTVAYTLRPDAIGKPSFHRWRVVVQDPDCSGGICDKSPDSGYVTHKRRVTFKGWAKALLREMHVPRCPENKIAVIAWETNEGTAAVWNPLATTYYLPGATRFNSVGVRNYESLGQGLNGTRLTIERGFTAYGYGEIVRRLDRCAPPMKTARAIKRSKWCYGCSGGRYVTGFIRAVKSNYAAYANRLISTAV